MTIQRAVEALNVHTNPYEYALWAAFVLSNKERAFVSEKGTGWGDWDGWFIAGVDTPHGKIFRHLPNAFRESMRDIAPQEGFLSEHLSRNKQTEILYMLVESGF